MTVGDKMKEARIDKNMTQQELATQLNVSRSAVLNWEVGRNYPDLDTIVQLSDILEISLDELLRKDVTMIKKISTEQRNGKKRKIALKILIPAFLFSLLIIETMMYQEVTLIHDFFSPRADGYTMVKHHSEWTPVKFSEQTSLKKEWKSYLLGKKSNGKQFKSPYQAQKLLKMSSLFIDGKVVYDNSFSDKENIEIRITDVSKNKVIDQFTLSANTVKSVKKFKRKQNYFVEVKANKGEHSVSFF